MFKPNWLRLPGGIALALGLGALAPASAQPDPQPAAQNPTQSRELLLRVEGGQLQISENGGPFEVLGLKDTPEARHLKNLIERRSAAEGSSDVAVGPTILASGGGAGFFWNPFAKKDTRPSDKAGAPAKVTIPEKTGAPPKTDTTAPDKKG
jgi:hypothetical protein